MEIDCAAQQELFTIAPAARRRAGNDQTARYARVLTHVQHRTCRYLRRSRSRLRGHQLGLGRVREVDILGLRTERVEDRLLEALLGKEHGIQ